MSTERGCGLRALVCFALLFKTGEITVCLSADGNVPVNRGMIMIQKRGRGISGMMSLSR